MPLFRPLAPLAARWDAADGTGLEHLNLKPDGDRIVADSVVIGGRGGKPYGARYRIVCRSDWTVVSLDIETTDGRNLHVISDGNAHWSDADGKHMTALDGCIDVDLAGSPSPTRCRSAGSGLRRKWGRASSACSTCHSPRSRRRLMNSVTAA